MTRRPLEACFSASLLLLLLGGCSDNATPATSSPEAVPVVASTVSTRRISDRIEAIGTARANESIEVTARVSNRVTDIGFTEGAIVEKGQVLVELESSEARANLAAARADLVEIRSQLQRTEELIRSKAVSQSQLDQQRAQVQAAEARVNAAESVLRDHTLRAPFAGRVGLRRVSIGALVSPGEVVTTLDDITQMKLDFAVPETYLATLSAGLPISARSVAYPGETFEGVVQTVGSRIDPVTRTVTVRATLSNEEGRLRPGMFMTVVLEKNPREAIVLPEIALVPEGQRKYVFVLQGDEAIQREVEIGMRLPGEVEITSGLEVGEEVVVEGTQSLRNGSDVRRVEAPNQRKDDAA